METADTSGMSKLILVAYSVNRAKNFQLLPSRRHDFSLELMSPRKYSRLEDVLVVLSGGETPKPPYVRSKDVYAYSFNARQWFSLAPLPHDPGIEFASCVHDNDIFITGGGLLQTCFMRWAGFGWRQLGEIIGFVGYRTNSFLKESFMSYSLKTLKVILLADSIRSQLLSWFGRLIIKKIPEYHSPNVYGYVEI
jgi:hypothetical protein